MPLSSKCTARGFDQTQPFQGTYLCLHPPPEMLHALETLLYTIPTICPRGLLGGLLAGRDNCLSHCRTETVNRVTVLSRRSLQDIVPCAHAEAGIG